MITTAIKFIKYDKSKSIGVIVGIVISIFLIGQQIGILGFLTGLMGGIIENANPKASEIWVVDNITQNANELTKLDERIVQEIRSIDGVDNTYGIVVTSGIVKFKNGKSAPVTIVGSESPVFAGGPNPNKIIKGSLQDLTSDGAISAEILDESVFNNSLAINTRLEINGKEAFVKVQTKNARGFSGCIFYTTLSKARLFGNYPDTKINAIAVKVKPGYIISEVVNKINAQIYGVRAWDAQELKNKTVEFITVSSNIGTSFGTLIVFAIISGFFIIGLTLYSAALDRIKDYGTLKAIGATNQYVRNLILLQAFMFALLGYLIALLLILGFKTGVASAGLIITYSPVELFGFFMITVFIAVGGSFFAVKKINNVEPASVFRG